MKPSAIHCNTGRDCADFVPCVELSNGKTLCSLLPNCGCGDPDSTLRHYFRVLSLCQSDGDSWYKLDRESDLDQLVLYVLDDRDLIEHGGTVWCSWRTGLGEEVLAAMREHWPDSLTESGAGMN